MTDHKVRKFAGRLFALQALMVLLLAIATYMLRQGLERLNDSREAAFRSFLLAEELRQSSDELTSFSRSFVVTGDPEFERRFRAVLDIRNGQRPRPLDYHHIYWDLVTPAQPEPRPSGEAVALRQLMIREGFTAAELHKLDEAQEHSDTLVQTETVAMNAAKGLFDDGTGHFTVKKSPDRDLAIRLLHDAAYHKAKVAIMKPIDEFYSMFEARTAGTVATHLQRSRRQLEQLMLLLAATLILIAWSIRTLLQQDTQRERATAALLESEERYRLLADNISDVIWVYNPASNVFEYVSPSVLTLRGYTAEEAIGQTLEQALTPESVVKARERIGQLLLADRDGQEPETLVTPVPLVYDQTRKDGGTVPIEVRARVVRDPTSGKRLLLGVSRDVSSRLQAEQERQKLQQQLYQSQKMEAIGSLAGGMAHDFNNLLGVISGCTQFIVDTLPAGDSRRTDLEEIKNASERGTALVRQLLAFGRKQILEARVIDLNQVVTGIETILQRVLGEDIQLDVNLAHDLGSVLADAGQIEQVIMNLVINARDAMPTGGHLTINTVNLEIDHRSTPNGVAPGRYATLSVVDSGRGMDDATLARVFEPFFTTKGLTKGTGLGLSTVHGIVKQSSGEVAIASNLGTGTTVTVYLPLHDAAPSEMRPKAIPAERRGNETVLVAEDERAMRVVVERVLRKAGYTVLAAASGGEALALFEQCGGNVDLLLTDVVMPQLSGRQVAERLQQLKPTLKVLYMSGYTDEMIDRHGVLEPGMQLISKPFEATELTQRVRLILDEAQPVQA